jgi:hypothetical protein
MRNISQIVVSPVMMTPQGARSSIRNFADELDKTDDRGSGIRLRHQVAQDHQSPHQAPVTSRIAGGGEPTTASVVVSAASETLSTSSGSEISAAINTESVRPLENVVQPTGITESLAGSRVFGVHLLASTYLSELYASTGQATSPASLNTVPSASEGVTEDMGDVSPGAPGNVVAAIADTSSSDEAVGVFDLFARKVVIAAIDESRSSAPATVAPETSQEALWPEDSLRLTKQRDGSLTLWLRDYRMDDTQAIHVIGALVNEAASRGMHLGRILLNGREVWTSPHDY